MERTTMRGARAAWARRAAGGIAVAGAAACGAARGTPAPRASPADLAIVNASMLDVRTGRVLPETTILVERGLIARVTTGPGLAPRARRTLDARGRLVTPGLVDVHHHTHLVFNRPAGDGTAYRDLDMRADSVAAYRRELARAYLPFGVTAVRDVGSDERWLPMLLAWARPSADAPHFFPSGAYLVSGEAGRPPVPFAAAVPDSAAAAAKVRAYHAAGLRHVKLHWRMQEPAARATLAEARRLGMTAAGHVDLHVLTVDRALDLGLRDVEHVHTIAMSVMPEAELQALYRQLPSRLPGVTGETPGVFHLSVPEFWHHLGPADARVLALVEKLRATGASLTPTLHAVGQPLGLAYFASRPWSAGESTAGFTPAQRARAAAGYRIMASYVRRMHEAGVRLNLGTDAPDPGRAALSEMLLLHDAGIPMPAVFRIATLNGAETIGQGAALGSIEVGKRADLVVFDGDPLARPRDLLGGRTVVKGGVVWTGAR